MEFSDWDIDWESVKAEFEKKARIAAENDSRIHLHAETVTIPSSLIPTLQATAIENFIRGALWAQCAVWRVEPPRKSDDD